jgi:signal transduction histidine kinase
MVEMFNADSQSELRDLTVSDLYANPADREAFSTKLVEEGIVSEEELKLQTLSGEEIWGAVTAITTTADEQTVFDGAIQDVTERKESQERLREQRDNLEILNQVVRHDIRNKLQVVSVYAELLSEGVPAESDLETYVEQIQNSTRDAVELTKTARDLAEVMLAAETDRQPMNLHSTLEDEIESTRSEFPNAIVRVDGSLSSVQVQANELLGSVFRNLLKNAVQHNDKEIPEVAVAASEDGDVVRVEIADNGPGVPDGQKESIFGKGEKGLDSEGTGVGLYLVQLLVDSYGGAVWVTDNDPVGAVFIMELPTANQTTGQDG